MIYIFLLLMSLLLLFCLYAFNFEIMSPSIISVGMFFIAAVFAALNKSNWDIKLSGKSFFLLSSGILCMVITELFVKNLYRRELTNHARTHVTNRKQYFLKINKTLSCFIIIFSFCGVLLYIQDAIKLANGPASIFGGSIFFRINQFSKRSIELNLEGGISSIYVQFGKMVSGFAYIYLYKTINNIIYGEKLKDNRDSIIMLILYIVLIIFQGTRTPVINLFIFGLFTSFAKYMQRRGWVVKNGVGKRYIIRIIIIGIIAIPAFFVFGEYILGRRTGNSIWQYISEYIAGGIQHFDQYVKEPIAPNEHFGEETLAYVYQGLHKLGLSEFTRTIYLEYRWTNSFIHGNIYTFFRRPLQDYGILGMYIFTIVVYLIYCYLYYKRIKNIRPSVKSDAVMFLAIYIYYPLVYVPMESAGIANIISIGNMALYIFLYIAFRLIFNRKIKIK
mgnify:CR=1 FL=1